MAGLKRTGKKSSGGEGNLVYTNLDPALEHEARLTYVADLGLHTNDYKGDIKPDVQKIALGFEILGSTVELDGEEVPRILWDKPFNIYYQMTEKGTELAKFKIFNPAAKDGAVADWEKVLGSPVTITVVNVPDKKDPTKKYDNIASIQSIPKKFQKGIAEGSVETAIGDSDDANNLATKHLFGLAKWMFDRRIVDTGYPEADGPDESDIPF